MKASIALAACALGLFVHAPSLAADIAQRLAVCAPCHGADGHATMPGSPSLAAQPAVFLETQLVLIREGVRPLAQMKGTLDGMQDAELVAIARYYAQQPLRPAPGGREEAKFLRGKAIAERALCDTCHLARYQGQQQVPRLAGQREDYLLQSMRQFKSNLASGRDTIMAAALYGGTEEELVDLAHYLAFVR